MGMTRLESRGGLQESINSVTVSNLGALHLDSILVDGCDFGRNTEAIKSNLWPILRSIQCCNVWRLRGTRSWEDSWTVLHLGRMSCDPGSTRIGVPRLPRKG